jgi:ABC-type Fe3+ transport system substrate-binding protein
MRTRNLILLGMLAILGLSGVSYSKDTLIIISPHRKSIQEEFIPAFKKHYKDTYKTDIQVEWLDQGGTSDDIRFVRAKFGQNPKTSGVDIFWGGGTPTFLELSNDKLLEKYDLPKDLAAQIPEFCAGVPLYDKTKTWYASAISSFGIFYNKKLMQFEKIPEPKTWRDLADPKYINKLSVADPRRSGSANTLNTIILQTEGWDKGWQTLTAIAGNTRQFTHSSSDPIKAIVSGEASATMAIDFYAQAKIGDLGPQNLGFTLPEGLTVLDPDPVAILKGAPNRVAAERFVNYILSPESQAILMLPKGSQGGPTRESLGRMAINTKTYDLTEGKRTDAFNPFKSKAFFKLDSVKAGQMKRVFDDLLGAVHIDTHHELKAAWARIVKDGAKAEAIAEISKIGVSEQELMKLSEKWNNDIFRNKTINEWVESARKRYKSIAAGQKAG